MKKLVTTLEGAIRLNRSQQKEIVGGEKQPCCDPALHCCSPNPAPASCTNTWGNPNCQYLYSSGSSFLDCCI